MGLFRYIIHTELTELGGDDESAFERHYAHQHAGNRYQYEHLFIDVNVTRLFNIIGLFPNSIRFTERGRGF